MNPMKLLALAVIGTASMPALSVEGSAEAAKSKISMCVGCHGIPGYRTTFPEVYHVPKLGGQHANYLVAALKQYKSGERDHPTMRGIAESLSEKDMADLAAYYAAKN